MVIDAARGDFARVLEQASVRYRRNAGGKAMKLVIAIVHERDKHKVSDALLQAGHKFTIVASTGGFLRDGNVTFLVGTEDENVDR